MMPQMVADPFQHAMAEKGDDHSAADISITHGPISERRLMP